jgi:hypothetical protein
MRSMKQSNSSHQMLVPLIRLGLLELAAKGDFGPIFIARIAHSCIVIYSL